VFKTLIIELISPLQLSFFLILIAAVVHYISRNKKTTCILVCTSLIWLLIWSQPYSADLLLYSLERNAKAKSVQFIDRRSPDYILVLACYYNTEGNVPEVSRWSNCSLQRLVQTAILYRQTKSKIIITGGHFLENEYVNYSQKAKAFLISLGVPKDEIITTNKGTNTHEEIMSASQYVNDKYLIVVTTATHVLRVSNELNKITKKVAFFPVDYHSAGELTPYLSMPSITALEASRSAFYEHLALVKQHFSQ
tara:strand:+ start:1160 stop:1912 length:753 start_codon:yes stop_codon:yes gene_type:complete